jgi:hypothetical protein
MENIYGVLINLAIAEQTCERAIVYAIISG